VVGQKSSEEEEIMRQFEMKVHGSLERGMMYFVGIVVKKAIMPEVANNLKIQTERSISKGIGGSQSQQM
jgi:hypothetical protein